MGETEELPTHGEKCPTFVVTCHGTTRWSPNIGDLVTDTTLDRVGKAVGWDGETVSIAPLDGGEPWHTTTYRPASTHDRLRARVAVINREHRGHLW
ncbi:hypothetical protein V7793_04500 [Streptomyces sp. KLMMK]|uniref:hypothetical protein n=1 Tax=Streptomyces sp. KLMMK TaxID=3109353 RepID=UPI003000DEB0